MDGAAAGDRLAAAAGAPLPAAGAVRLEPAHARRHLRARVHSTLAVLAVSLFVLISYAVIVCDDPGPTPGDVTAQDVAESIRTAWLTTSPMS